MKLRITAAATALIMLFGTTAFAEDYWTKANDDIEVGKGNKPEATEVLQGNIEDIINNGWSNEFADIPSQEEKYVSPYTYEIDLVVKLGLMEAIPNNYTGNENDFCPKQELSYYDYIYALEQLIKSSGTDVSGLQSVTNVIISDRAIKDLVSITGYDVIYPQKDVWTLAGEYGILKGVSVNKNRVVTREQFAKLIANLLEVELVSISIDGEKVKYETADKDTLLSRFDVFRIDGWVNANEYTNMYSSIPSEKGTVQIDNVVYSIGDTNAAELTGRYIRAYIREIDDILTVIKIDVLEKRDNYILLNDSMIESIDEKYIKYTESPEDKREKSIKLEENGYVVFNGKYAGTVASARNYLYLTNGVIGLSDTNFNGAYDCIFIWQYKTHVAEQVSKNRIALRGEDTILDLDDTDKTVVITMNGERISVSDITSMNVLSVAKSLDGEMYTVKVSDKKIVGTVTSISADKILVDNGMEYLLDEGFSDIIEYNKEYSFYISVFGKITAAGAPTQTYTKTGTGRNYGYLRRSFEDEDEPEIGYFRIFRISDSKWITLKGTEKLDIYTNEVKDGAQVKKRMKSGDAARLLYSSPQLIVFETNIHGEVKSITLAVDYYETGELNDKLFTYNKHSDNNIRTYYGGYFGGIYSAGAYAYVRVPVDRSQEKYYEVLTAKGDGNLHGPMDIYDVSESLSVNGVVLYYTEAGTSVDSRGDARITVSKIELINNDDENAYKITALGGKEYFIEDSDEQIGMASSVKGESGGSAYHVKTASELKVGDVMCANVDSLGYITGFRVEVRLSEINDSGYFAYKTNDDPPVLSIDYGVVMKNAAGNTVVLNTSADKNPIYNRPKVVSGIMYTYYTKTGKFEQLDSKTDILPGDRLVTLATYYYTDVTAIVIK